MTSFQLTTIRILALIGLGISISLLVLKLDGTITSIQGCGAGSGCENVLGSKWSQWFGIPVSAFSSVLYTSLLGLTFRPKEGLFRLTAFILIGAAMWFIGLQIFVIESFCIWCCTAHTVGLLAAFALLRSIPKAKTLAPTIVPTLLSLVVLVLGQTLGPEPETNLFTKESIAADTAQPPLPIETVRRIIDLGGKKIVLGQQPFIGRAHAEHVLVKYFDYTCQSCLELEGDLAALKEKHPGQFAIVLSPTPLNRACNPHFPPHLKNHDHACELARLGLAAWIAKPNEYPKVHKLLFSRPILTPARAQEEVGKIIGAKIFAEALKSPKIDVILKANTNDFQQLSRQTVAMPKLLFEGGGVSHGLSRNTATFIQQIEGKLQISKKR
ncbi:MAG: vitamin K epoxide reductase family protein [Akkermansiaceae bacterium]